MAEQIDIDGVRFKIGYDSKAVADGLKKDEEAAKGAGERAGKGFGQAFSAVAGAIAGASVISFFKGAVNEANKLEASLNRVQSAAKAFGLSTKAAAQAAQDLSQDGFLSLNQSASALSNLMSTGLNIDQSKKFIEASKNISAFGNTIGDASSAIESGIKGIITGSTELVENMSPAMKKLSMEFTVNKTKVGEAKAVQALYNGVLKLGNQYAGDAAKYLDTAASAQNRFAGATGSASAAIGQGLQPILKSLFNTLTGIVEGFTKWFGGLNESTQAIVILGAGLAALVPVLAAIGGALAFISFNPVVLGVTAAIVAFTTLATIIAQFGGKSFEKLETNYRETRKEAEKLGETADRLSKTHKRTAQEELTLLETKEKLRQKAKALGLDYDNLAKSAKSYLDIAEALAEKEKLNAKADLSDRLSRRIAAFNRAEAGLSAMQGQIQVARNLGDTRAAASLERNILSTNAFLEKERAAIRAENAKIESFGTDALTPIKKGAGGADGGRSTPEFRFIEARDQLRKLQDEYEAYLRRVGTKSPLAVEAGEKFKLEKEAIEGQLRQSIAEYTEDKYMADKKALDLELDQQIANVYRLKNLDKDGKINVENETQKLREANARKTAALQAESFARTMQGASMIAGGISQIGSAKTLSQGIGGAGGILQGFGGLSEKFKSFGAVGQGISAFAGVASVIQGFYEDDAEQQRRIAEDQKRRDEEAKAILELQANYQKSMLALQEAAARLPFENLSRELRLIDIQAQQARVSGADETSIEQQRLASRQSAINNVLSRESGTISGGALFGGTQGTASGLTDFLKQRAEQTAAVGQFMQLLELVGSGSLSPGQYAEVDRQLQSFRGKIPDELYMAASEGRGKDFGYGGLRVEYDKGRLVSETVKGSAAKIGAARELFSEITRDTATAENLLSVIDQQLQTQLDIAKSTKQTAENTKPLTLRGDRERSFIDVGQGFIASLGQRITSRSALSVAGSLADRGFALPSSIGSASGVALTAGTLQERMALALEMQVTQGATMIDILSDVRQLSAELVAVMDGNAATVSGLSLSEFSRIQSEVNRRRR